MLERLLKDPRTERVILTLIILNAITLGLETSPSAMAAFGPVLIAIDRMVLAVFVLELAARLVVHRLSFFRDPWSVFDLAVALRVLRVLRLITAVPSLQRVVGGLVSALPGMGSITLLLALILYVFAVMATKLFGQTHPEQFGTLGATAYSLFQVMTFDDWSGGIVKPLAEQHPYAIAFFLVFILLSTFMALNLFIGVIVNAIDAETAEDAPKLTHPSGIDERLVAEISALRAEIAELKGHLSKAA
jgi:voltage-gated sodium channel